MNFTLDSSPPFDTVFFPNSIQGGDFNIRVGASSRALTLWHLDPPQVCWTLFLTACHLSSHLRAPPPRGKSDHNLQRVQLSCPHPYSVWAPRPPYKLPTPLLPLMHTHTHTHTHTRTHTHTHTYTHTHTHSQYLLVPLLSPDLPSVQPSLDSFDLSLWHQPLSLA
jgi:hypothetical protein